MDNKKVLTGHLSALVTVVIWATTFVSTKHLLEDFAPLEILLVRFAIGYLALLIIKPEILRTENKKDELYFIAAGLCGVTLYFLLENIALTYTLASNVGVVVSVSPFLIGVLAHFFLEGERLRPQFLLGFLISITGIVLVVFNGSFYLKISPIGDLLALGSTVMWAVYSILMRKISLKGYQGVNCTRRVFFYGILFMVPALFLMDFNLTVDKLTQPVYILNLLYLGLGASALCFVSWNRAVSILGAMRTGVYIYTVPAITLIASALILKERITWMALLGAALTIAGLIVSERKRQPQEEDGSLEPQSAELDEQPDSVS